MMVGDAALMDIVRKKVRLGQLTFEMLLLLLLSISLLFIAISAITKIKHAHENVYELKVSQMQIERLARLADEVCVMGPGNSRTLRLSQDVGFEPRLESERVISAQIGDTEYSKRLLCEAEIIGDFGSFAYVWYEYDPIFERGVVKISSIPVKKG